MRIVRWSRCAWRFLMTAAAVDVAAREATDDAVAAAAAAAESEMCDVDTC